MAHSHSPFGLRYRSTCDDRCGPSIPQGERGLLFASEMPNTFTAEEHKAFSAVLRVLAGITSP
jgi:hypothetical protein